MEPFKVHILGCGSALPTLKHNASSQVVEIRGKYFMIDCGEGTQIQLRRSKIHFMKISAVYISHLHGDHCLGLIGMLSTFGMLGRTAPIHIYAPGAYEPMLNSQIEMFCNGLEYEVVFHAVDTKSNVILYEDKSLTIESIPLQHRIDCCGFLFREKPLLPHIKRDVIDCYEVPISQINNIKNGADWVSPDGVIISNDKFVEPSLAPRSYAYCSDTRYVKSLPQLLKGISTLYHEATYTNEFASHAKKYYHSTAEQAAKTAKESGVNKLILGHFSARYENENRILEEAKKIFDNCYLADEGMTFDI